MKGKTYVYRNGRLVEKHRAAPVYRGPMVISDTMDAMVHPSTGKMMDSKSQFRAVTRAKGCVEVGNETMRDTRQTEVPGMKQDIARAIQQLGG